MRFLVVQGYEVERGAADAIVWLQPTSPFRTSDHIDASIELFEREHADTVQSVHTVHDHPYSCWRPLGRYIEPYVSELATTLERCSLPVVYAVDGAINVVKWSVAAAGKFFGHRVVPYLMSERECLDIDTPEDLAFARFVLSNTTSTASPDGRDQITATRSTSRDGQRFGRDGVTESGPDWSNGD